MEVTAIVFWIGASGVENSVKYNWYSIQKQYRWLPLNTIILAIVLSVLLRYTDSDYPFGIFKLFLYIVDYKANYIILYIW